VRGEERGEGGRCDPSEERGEEREGKGTNLSKNFNEIKVMNRKSSRE
jgi:hypothetical protein